MRTRTVWALPTALITGLTLAVPIGMVTAQAATPARTAGPAPASPKAVKPSRTARTVVLPTGDRVEVITGTNGRQTIVSRPAAKTGPGRVLITRVRGAHTYVTPLDAMPYLGHSLDPGLFDVTRLAAAQTPNEHLPVTISYTGSKPSAPGVTITSASGGVAQGYLTPASSAVFGRALSAQWKSDAAAGRPHSSTLFGGLRKISADMPGAPSTAHPAYAQYTLKAKVTGPDGKPEADGSIELMNVDDSSKVDDTVEVVDGQARFSVPKGHYSAIALNVQTDNADNDHVRLTTVTQIDVEGAGQTITIDHRKATIAPSVSVPKAATLTGYNYIEQRTDAADSEDTLNFDVQLTSPLDFRYAPAGTATVGRLDLFQKWSLSGGKGSGAYTYDLATGADRIPATPRYVFTAKNLATIKASYYSDGSAHDSAFFRSANYPHENLDGAAYVPLTLGVRRTEYVGATGSPTWSDELAVDVTSIDAPGYLDTPDRKLPAGSIRTANWMRGPIAAGIPRLIGPQGDDPIAGEDQEGHCFACRTTKGMSLSLHSLTDSDAYHFGDDFGDVDGLAIQRFRVYKNNTKIEDVDDETGDDFAVPPGKAAYRVYVDADRRLSSPAQSTLSQTRLTFSSTANTGAKLPAGWDCDLASSCRVLPLVQAKLSLPTDLHGRLPIGKSTVTVTVASLQNSTESPATSAGLQIRPTNGFWTPVKLTSIGGGKYRGTIDNTANLAGLNVDVEFTGADKAGSTFKQTVLHAYTVAGS